MRVYFPHIEQFKRPSTLRGYRDIWENPVKARSLVIGSKTFAHPTYRTGLIRSQASEHSAATIFAVAAFTGLRRGEIQGCGGKTTVTIRFVSPAQSGKAT